MAIELTMPALSPTMEKGTLAKWLVGVGDQVRPGDLLAEIETDKATMEFEAIDEGHVTELVVAEGTDDVPVGAVIARLDGEDAGDPEATPTRSAVPAPRAITVAPAPARPVAAVPTRDDRSVDATPLARKIASASGIELSRVAGSGPRGRVVKSDLHAAGFGCAGSVADAPSAPSAAGRGGARREPRVTRSSLTMRCNVDALLTLLARLNAEASARGALSAEDMLIRAMALALEDVPVADARPGEAASKRIDIMVARADDAGPAFCVLEDVPSLSLSAIARHRRAAPVTRDVGNEALPRVDFAPVGVETLTSASDPSAALVLTLGAGIEQPWKVEGDLALATVVAATISFDATAIGRAAVARFIAAFRARVEEPWSICC